ncbi:hypothetical protein CEXT_664691 [Caerostris extrusa]|uniref:Uncharacterized protein n=1 Tax=Caerostris extrusa TaxID=172846 RepID=A0AAV4PD61_CAEEX|nr:hypothetical protein CEXT_664691 [Caerostris extrusa]
MCVGLRKWHGDTDIVVNFRSLKMYVHLEQKTNFEEEENFLISRIQSTSETDPVQSKCYGAKKFFNLHPDIHSKQTFSFLPLGPGGLFMIVVSIESSPLMSMRKVYFSWIAH